MCLIISTSCCKVSLCNFDSQFSLHTTVYCVYLGLEFTNLERIFCNMFKILSHFYFEPEVPPPSSEIACLVHSCLHFFTVVKTGDSLKIKSGTIKVNTISIHNNIQFDLVFLPSHCMHNINQL
jgi:hypothetical protein